jgi:hypothetical protein
MDDLRFCRNIVHLLVYMFDHHMFFILRFETYPASDITRDYSVFQIMSVFIALLLCINPVNQHRANERHVAK